MKVCKQCTKPLSGRRRLFCSGLCKGRWHQKRRKPSKPHVKQCPVCGNAFATKHKRSRVCGNYKCRGHNVKTQANQRAAAIESSGEKQCSKCKETKPLTAFSQREDNPTRYHSWCRNCESEFVDKENRKEYVRRYASLKYKNNICYRLNRTVSSIMRSSLVGGKGGKRCAELLGYSMKDLKRHLEKRFERGMSWGNYGKWHIDHIIPISAFNYSSPDHLDFKRCWSLNNLQPLWAEENLRKKDKLDKEFQPSLEIDAP